jgi:8-oxo-dGTP pyrophosphatase MutT (NUDIX family)
VRREFSAGGVLVRRLRGRWVMAAIRPAGREPPVWALPKGLIDQGEKPEQTALREVAEETGIEARLVTKLGDVRYVYTWDGERVFKVVSFYLFRYGRGRLGEITPEQRIEVAEARWLPLEDAPGVLAYKGEREMTEKALAFIRDNRI